MIHKVSKDRFLENIVALCKIYNLSLSHEDGQGSFIVEEYKEENIEWLKAAYVREEKDGWSK